MPDLKAALLGPPDLPGREFTLGSAHVERKVKKDKNGQEKVFFKVTPSYSVSEPPCTKDRQPNLGLLFQRYAPEHLEKTLVTNALLNELISEGINQPGYLDREEGWLKDAVRKSVTEIAKQWHGSLALEWFTKQAKAASIDRKTLENARGRWQETLERVNPKTEFFCATLSKRAVIGLANASPWENSGWAFHHTYGVPMIPGDSLKGLMRHYLEEELGSRTGKDLLEALGFSDGDRAAQYLAALSPQHLQSLSAKGLANLLFGKPGSDGAEGLLAVYDVWPEAPDGGGGWFALDVVTSHHRDYYTSGYGENSKASDKDQPNPVHFLTLRPGLNFHIALASTAVADKKPSDFIQAIVEVGKALCLKALAEWGVGAKTGTGYGRMR
jgi:CRISPR type III-B/RAMP module RAMP protein Cmr6